MLGRINEQNSQTAIEKDIAAALTRELRGIMVLRTCSIHPGLNDEEIVDIVNELHKIGRSQW
jgi:L-2,4-diaminobutyrate decarboxylase